MHLLHNPEKKYLKSDKTDTICIEEDCAIFSSHDKPLKKWLQKKLAENYMRMLRVLLNISWKQDPTKQQIYSHLPAFSQRKVSKDELVRNVLLTHTLTQQYYPTNKKFTLIISVRTLGTLLRTC